MTPDRDARAGGESQASPEDVLAQFFMERAQQSAPEGDARRTRPTSFDRRKAHAALNALRAAGWRIFR